MKVFVTGGSGHVGQALIPELVRNGHTVLGLARSSSAADKITKAGAEVIDGDLYNHAALQKGAQECDGIIHMAFVHDFSSPEARAESTKTDRAVIQAMGDAIAGTGKPLIIASGLLGLKDGELSTEDDLHAKSAAIGDRDESRELLFKLSEEKNIRGMVVRLAPTVHGRNDWGFITMLGEMAKKHGFVTIIDRGEARWSAAHKDDVAVLLRLALEQGRAGGVYNGNAEEGVAWKDIAQTMGEKLHLPVESKTTQEALPLLGFFAHAINMDAPVSSERTRKELGWTPKQVGLLDDIKQNYFE